MRRAALLIVAILLIFMALVRDVIACAAHPEVSLPALADELATWRNEKSHPLIGVVIDRGKPLPLRIGRGTCETWAALRLPWMLERDITIILLGEVHDNPRHHAYRAGWLVPGSNGEQPQLALVFEQIRFDQRAALDQFATSSRDRPAPSTDLFRLLEWDKSGWPDQKIFEPLFAAAVAAKLPILPGDPPRGRTREVARGGLDAVPAEERARLKLDTPLPAPLAAELNKELKDSHCGLLPDSAIPGLARAQHYRDAHLADALLAAADTHGSAILLTGNGHVRTDRGVPWHIRQRAPGKKVVSVMLIEVEDGKTDPEAYVPRAPDGTPAADYILFTPRAARADPCAEMRKAYGRK